MGSLQDFLMGFFVHKIEGTMPRLVELERPITILGISLHTSVKTISRDVPQLGRRFEMYKRQNEIPHRKQPWAFAAVSKDYDEQAKTFWYIIGDVVTSAAEIPSGLESFEIPAGEYAVFPVRPKNRFGWGPAIANVKRYAYGVWLPGSGYEAAGNIDDFEYHDERSTRKQSPEIDLYIAVRQRHSLTNSNE